MEKDLTLNENRSYKLKVWIAALCFALCSGLVAVGVSLTKQFKRSNAVSYDYTNYQITLNVEELNNYVFTNYANYIFEIDGEGEFVHPLEFSYLLYGNSTFDFVHQVQFYDFMWFIEFANETDYILFNRNNSNKFELMINNNISSFANELTFVFGSTYSSNYTQMKTLIELDIQANQPSNPSQDILSEIVSLLTGGITGIATGIGTGVNALVGDIFISEGALSVFGAVLCIFGGVALAIGLSRWVMNFLTSLGAKK